MIPTVQEDLVEDLAAQRLVAIVRGRRADAVEATARTLADAGVRLLEVSLTSPDAVAVIARLAADLPADVRVGAGTVLRSAQADDVVAAGAAFAVTPDLGEGARRCIDRDLPTLVGAMTPTEVTTARAAGAAAVKLFPAGALGPEFLRAVRAPLPDVPFVPVGGVGAADVPDWFAAGAVAVGVGSPLVGDAADGGDLAALRDRAARLLGAVRG